MVNNVQSIYFAFFLVIKSISTGVFAKTFQEICPTYKKGPGINVADLVGSWMTVYTQPEAIDCFTVHIRATTELERELFTTKYGNFNESVDWSRCFLQVETPQGKHFLQGNGTESGLMENIIIFEDKPGEYRLQNATADQWMVYGRRGSEVLITRDCFGETAAAFARAHYWPKLHELSAIFHRSGIAIHTHKNTLCQPKGVCNKKCNETPRLNQKGSIQELNVLQFNIYKNQNNPL